LYSHNAHTKNDLKQNSEYSLWGGASAAVAPGGRINWAAKGGKIKVIQKKGGGVYTLNNI